MSTIEMDGKIEELRELRRMTDELQAEMTARNVDIMAGTDWRVTLSAGPSSWALST